MLSLKISNHIAKIKILSMAIVRILKAWNFPALVLEIGRMWVSGNLQDKSTTC